MSTARETNSMPQGDIDSRIGTLEMVVSEIDTQIHHMMATIVSNSTGAPAESDARAPMRDAVWACANCCARLGIYNEDRDQLRVRYKDFVAYINPGAGGSVMVPCRRCGEQNILTDTRPSK